MQSCHSLCRYVYTTISKIWLTIICYPFLSHPILQSRISFLIGRSPSIYTGALPPLSPPLQLHLVQMPQRIHWPVFSLICPQLEQVYKCPDVVCTMYSGIRISNPISLDIDSSLSLSFLRPFCQNLCES